MKYSLSYNYNIVINVVTVRIPANVALSTRTVHIDKKR